MEGAEWLGRLEQDLRSATSVVLASLAFDEPSARTGLQQRLGSKACSVEIFVDKTERDKGTARFQRASLQSLMDLGAVVRLCSGKPRSSVFGDSARGRGAFHKKLTVVDKKILYVGSANCAKQSRCNDEIMVRLMGPKAMTALDGLASARGSSVLMGAGA